MGPSTAVRALLLAPVACAALVSGCALVLGFEDHEPYPTDGGATGSGGASASSSSSAPSSSSASGLGGDGATTGTGGALPMLQFGTPEILASGQAGPSEINLDGTTVYWVNAGLALEEAGIMKSLKSGGEAVQVGHSQFTLMGLELTATSVLSAEYNINGAASYIAVFAKGSNTNFPGMLYTGGDRYYTVALQGTVIAWSSNASNGSVLRGDTQSSSMGVVATGQGKVGRLALDGTVTYWVSPEQNAIMRDTAGTLEIFAGGQSSPTDITVDADTVYWTGNDGSVKRLAKTSPGGQPILIAGDALSPQGIALDATNVYWAESDSTSGRVRTAPKGGGKVETIATGQYPIDVAVDSTAVYVTMQGDGNVLKIPKK